MPDTPLLKCRPEDFQVEEILEPQLLPTGRGVFRIYRLKKTGWTTADAIDAIARSSSAPKNEIRYAGRKDRHAVTIQFISAPQNYCLVSHEKALELQEVGGLNTPLAPSAIKGNLFKLALRRVHPSFSARLRDALQQQGRHGFPNYFDEQRFRSVGKSGTFIAERIVKKQFSGALKLYLCEERRRDCAQDRQRRKQYNDSWGDWNQLFAMAKKIEERRILDTLKKRPGKEGMAAALSLIPRDDLEMYFAAWQSFLWNETLSLIMNRQNINGSTTCDAGGELLFPFDVEQAHSLLNKIEIPTAASRLLSCDEEVRQCIMEVLKKHDVRPPQMNIRKMRAVHFSSFCRNAWTTPHDFKIGPLVPDTLHAARLTQDIEFTLPRGSYATMLVKAAITALTPLDLHKAARFS